MASLMGGTKKSSARSAPMESKTGNYGKAIGDKGKKCPNGNKKTRGAADRYK
jgi:hypothetical protein